MIIKEILDSICKSIQDFGDSMQTMNNEFSDDIKKSNQNAKSRAIKDKENLDKIWGKKK